MGQHVREAGGNVAQAATVQASHVVTEARQQAGDLLGEMRGQAQEQVSAQHHKAAQGLQAFAGQLDDMAASTGQGTAGQLAQEASQRIRGLASWLVDREPGDLLEEVRGFARRRPGTFLLGAGVAGVVAGRLSRGVTAAATSGEAEEPAPR